MSQRVLHSIILNKAIYGQGHKFGPSTREDFNTTLSTSSKAIRKYCRATVEVTNNTSTCPLETRIALSRLNHGPVCSSQTHSAPWSIKSSPISHPELICGRIGSRLQTRHLGPLLTTSTKRSQPTSAAVDSLGK